MLSPLFYTAGTS